MTCAAPDTRVANELLDDIDTAETDLMQSYAMPLPVQVIARLLGIPGEDYLTFKRWSTAVFAFTSLPPEERAKSTQEMLAYFGRMATARRAHGAEDLITALVEAEVEGEALEEWEILGFCMLLLIAGNETTTGLIGNVLNILVDRPELWRRLRAERSRVETRHRRDLAVRKPRPAPFSPDGPRGGSLRGEHPGGGQRLDFLWGGQP